MKRQGGVNIISINEIIKKYNQKYNFNTTPFIMKLFNEGVELNKKNICEYLDSQKSLIEKLKIEQNIKKKRTYLEDWIIEKEMNKFLNINQKLNYIKTRIIFKSNKEQKTQNKKRRWRQVE